MRYLASRIAIVGSLGFLNLWIASALVSTGALALGNFGLAASMARPAWTIDLPLFGFLGLMIFGLEEHFTPLFAGRELASPRLAILPVVLGIASVGLSLLVPRLTLVGRLLWLSGSVVFVLLVLASLKVGAIRIRPRPGERLEGLRDLDARAGWMTVVASVYLLGGSIGFALAAPGGRALLPVIAPYGSSFLHLFTLGFVFVAVAAIALHLLPRFWDVLPSPRPTRVLTILAVVSPAGVAATLPSASTVGPLRYVFIAFALGEALAAVSFAFVVGWMWHRSRMRRPAAPFFVLGGMWLVGGVLLGGFAAASETGLRLTTIHAWIALFGFAGLMLAGISHEILPPYAHRGLRAWGRAVRVHVALATVGLVLVVVSQGLAVAGYPRSSWAVGSVGFAFLLAMTLSYAAGTFITLAAISPPPDGER